MSKKDEEKNLLKREEVERLARVVKGCWKISNIILMERALQRRVVFSRLRKYPEIIKRVVHRLDSDAEVYLLAQ